MSPDALPIALAEWASRLPTAAGLALIPAAIGAITRFSCTRGAVAVWATSVLLCAATGVPGLYLVTAVVLLSGLSMIVTRRPGTPTVPPLGPAACLAGLGPAAVVGLASWLSPWPGYVLAGTVASLAAVTFLIVGGSIDAISSGGRRSLPGLRPVPSGSRRGFTGIGFVLAAAVATAVAAIAHSTELIGPGAAVPIVIAGIAAVVGTEPLRDTTMSARRELCLVVAALSAALIGTGIVAFLP